MSAEEPAKQQGSTPKEAAAEEPAKQQGSTPKEAAPAANEPIAEAPSTAVDVEKVVDAVAALIPGIGAQLYLASAVLVFVFVVIGTPVTWFYQRNPKTVSTDYISLWKATTTYDLTNTDSTLMISDLTCKALKDRFRAAEAFSIISIGFSLVALVVGYVNMKLFNQLKVPVVIVSLLASLSTIITWGIGVNIYSDNWCQPLSLYKQEYSLYAGAGLFIVAWILTILGPILCFWDPAAPTGDRLGRFAIISFTLAMAVAFSFSLAGTATTTWFQRVFSTKGESDYSKIANTLWSQTITNAQSQDSTVMYKDMRGCDDFTQMWFAASGFSVISVVFGFLALVAGVYNTVVSGSSERRPLYRTAIAFGILNSFFMLVTWAIAAKIYYGRWCNQVYYFQGNMYTAQAGFALFVVGWVVSTIGSIGLVIAYVLSKDSPFAKSSRAGLLFAAIIFVALIFSIVGSATSFANFNLNNVQADVGLWQITQSTLTSTVEISIGDLTCSDYKERIRAGEAFSILSCIFLFVSFLLAVSRFHKPSLRIPASGVALFGSICQLITWGVGATIYNTGFCGNASLRASGYTIGPGLALYVTAWCITLVISIVNIIVE